MRPRYPSPSISTPVLVGTLGAAGVLAWLVFRPRAAVASSGALSPVAPHAHGPELLPVLTAPFNLREVCKQSALLEDHLNDPEKMCRDCIRKHFLTIEAFYEEAAGLDKTGAWSPQIVGKAAAIRRLQQRWIDGEAPAAIAQELRAMRKEMTPTCFDVRVM